MEFRMSPVEVKHAREWVEKHFAEAHGGKAPYCGAAGGSLSYTFTPTGLGTCITVRCVCGAEENCTDFDQW